MAVIFGAETQQEIKTNFHKIPRIFIHWRDWRKMLKYTQKAAPNEIMGLGKIKRIDDDFYVSDIFIIKHDSFSPDGVNITESAAQFVYELVQKNESPADYKFCWHSHIDSPTAWSSIDEETATNFNNEYMISLVLNVDGDYALRFDMFKPVKMTIYNLPLKIILPDNKKLDEEVAKEIEEKLKPKFPFGRRKRQETKTEGEAGQGLTEDDQAPAESTGGDENEAD